MKFLGFLLFIALTSNLTCAQEMLIISEDDIPTHVREKLAKSISEKNKTAPTADNQSSETISLGFSKSKTADIDDDDEMITLQPKSDESYKSFEYPSDLFAIGALSTGAIITATAIKDPTIPKWQGGVLFDEKARTILRAGNTDTRQKIATASDVLDALIIAYPIADPIIYGMKSSENQDDAIEMSLVNVESYLITAIATSMTKKLAARERPFGENCPGDPMCAGQKGRYESFFSGHSAFAFTGAGLICAHHGAKSIYEGDMADKMACWIAITAATAVGAMRVASDKHYASDVLTGAAIGLFSGYIIPKLTHYRGPKTLYKRGIILEPTTMRNMSDDKRILGIRFVKKF